MNVDDVIHLSTVAHVTSLSPSLHSSFPPSLRFPLCGTCFTATATITLTPNHLSDRNTQNTSYRSSAPRSR